MNKNLIALAVAGAFVAPAAMAQTANPVTLYGQVNVTLESVEAKGGASPVSSRTRVEDQSSRLGVKGTEDLGGGLKAFFQLETAFRADQAGTATSFANRNSAVGLQGGWGSLLLGRWDAPMKQALGPIDVWGNITIAGLTGVVSDRGNFDNRFANVVQYWSSNYGGFAFKLAASANEGKGCTTSTATPPVTTCLNPRNSGANLTFARGPMYLMAAWEEHKDVSAAIPKEEGYQAGGTFAFGPVKLGGAVQEFKKTGRTKQKSYMANVTFTAGNNQFVGQYMNSKDGLANSAATQPDCDSASVGYKYNFSRRTQFFAQYLKVDNNSAATCNFGSNTLAISAGQDPQGFALGILHNF